MSETATATVVRYSVTTFENFSPQFSRVANQSIIMGLTWDDVIMRMARATVSSAIELVGHCLDIEQRPFFYRDHEDKLCKLVKYER